jgi:hypothetical protein
MRQASGPAAHPSKKKPKPATTKILTDFLIELSTSASAFAAFKADPETIMQEAGLTKAQRDAVKSKDPNRLSAAVLAEFGVQGPTPHTYPVTIVLIDF